MNASNEDNQEAQSLLAKKRKTIPNHDNEGNDIVSFLLASDLSLLTDYFILLFSQVTRGVMNEADLLRAKKVRPCNKLGFFGIACRHCNGVERGKYFPSCSKNLCATPPTLHAHLLICPNVPEPIKRALKLTKTRHKYAAMTKPSGSQSAFFRNLWERIQSPTFTGDDATGLATIQTEVNFIIAQSQPKSHVDIKVQRAMQIARQHGATTTMSGDPTQGELPNVVSYDLDNEYNYTYAAQALDVELKETAVETPTEEDFELVLDLLMQPETPEDRPSDYFQSEDIMNFASTPIPVGPGSGIKTPIPTRVNSFGEQYTPNGDFIVSSNYDAMNLEEEEEMEAEEDFSSPKPNDAGRTRRFTRSDEILLVRGIIKHGRSKWKKIWDETPELQKIKHSALKDRARSKRFCRIVERARENPMLLSCPQELCGDENSPAYHSPKSSTPRAKNGGTTPNNTCVEPFFSAYGPLHRR